MGKLIKTCAICVAVLFVSVIGIRYSIGDARSIQFKVFSELYSGHYFNKIIGIVPSDIGQHFVLKEVDSNNKIVLLSLKDTVNNKYFDYLILKDRNSQTEYLLKAYPITLFKSNSQKDMPKEWESYLPNLINLERFNDYVHSRGIYEQENIIDLYLYFLSDLDDSTSYRIIHSLDDINDIISDSHPNKLQTLQSLGYKIYDGQDLKFDAFQYCWFYNKGIIQFRFEFDKKNGMLLDVRSEGVGYLGNEIPVIP